MPRASSLADQLATSSQVFDHRESVSTRRRISIETGDCAQRCSERVPRCNGACAACSTIGRCKKAHCRCRGASSTAGGLGVLACLVTTIALVVVWLQHELAPSRPVPPPPPVSRCSAGVERTYTVNHGDTCSFISHMNGVPEFDIVDRNTTRSCCESDAIEADDVVEFCKSPPRARWLARGLPQEKIVMTYIGGVGFLNPPTRFPESVNVVALAFAVDADGTGMFELGKHPDCVQPDCGKYQGEGFEGDCSTQNKPSDIAGRRGPSDEPLARQNADKSRRWLISIVPRVNTLWPYKITAKQWGENAAVSLEAIILRYRLDGIDVDFEGYLDSSHYDVFTSALCSLFSALRERLPHVVITIALYGNPEMPDRCPGRCTIGQYSHLKNACDHLVDAYLYQDYANRENDESSNRQYIEAVGNEFGWSKFGFGVGVANDPWRWYPDNPGTAGKNILSTLLTGPNGKNMRGVFTWAGEFSFHKCTPSWCVEDLLAEAIAPNMSGPATCTCENG